MKLIKNAIELVLAEAQNIAGVGPDINGTTVSLIIVACTLLIAVAIAAYIHFCK